MFLWIQMLLIYLYNSAVSTKCSQEYLQVLFSSDIKNQTVKQNFHTVFARSSSVFRLRVLMFRPRYCPISTSFGPTMARLVVRPRRRCYFSTSNFFSRCRPPSRQLLLSILAGMSIAISARDYRLEQRKKL